mmetsp:Transcript_6618/g.19083  ORF Transcript_6618/g.19083 Transcript_6618/m.19083 type:complete len:132 (-) Transcript_6618:413-808(-)|eukprot:CAMPEP_0206139948 /NCGR_PEP_ID=MMETSP1473-20131121/7824_1 /ASSEMBLY_ACC=CAM_ASM_001109 /TAXON_ID=1461547 /ORGANISM="Stichococcus sp, Strain RCC1054" /LENGTH=131 /DNA_ID=CAMNT_0053533899 /DNA_START=154 /DNA_END=549 /DNA_ORIENTATION=+
MAPRKVASRGKAAEPATDPAEEKISSTAPETDAEEETEKLSGLWYNVKQHAGISLGSLSVFLAIWTFEEDHPWSVTKMMLCFMLCLVALGLHEIRPYQRRSYGNVWWEQLTQGGSGAGPTAGFERVSTARY